MKTPKKTLSIIAGVGTAICMTAAANAADPDVQSVAVQSEIQSDEMPLITDIIYEAALADAAAKTLEEDKDWFRVTYRDVRTDTVTRNVNSDAESRYLDMEDGERLELEIPTRDATVQVQKIEFTTGSGETPEGSHSFDARSLSLPGT